jgi:elongation factor G
VCDGAVTIFDGMMGVETQSETVWMQANKFNVPRIGFINKLDRLGADVTTTTNSIKRRLKIEPMMINIPAGDTNTL